MAKDLQQGFKFLERISPEFMAMVKGSSDYRRNPSIPFPNAFVADLQHAAMVLTGAKTLDPDRHEALSIQQALSWNRVINVVAESVALGFANRALVQSADFSQFARLPQQTHLFVHKATVGSTNVDRYWVMLDQHPTTEEVTLCIHAGQRAIFAPVRSSWDAAASACALANAQAIHGEAAGPKFAAELEKIAQWEPVIAFLYQVLIVEQASHTNLSNQLNPANSGFKYLHVGGSAEKLTLSGA